MSEQPGKLITLRLTEYYERKQELETPSPKESQLLENGHSPVRPFSQQNRSNASEQVPGNDILEISHHATENADEAAQYWAGISS